MLLQDHTPEQVLYRALVWIRLTEKDRALLSEHDMHGDYTVLWHWRSQQKPWQGKRKLASPSVRLLPENGSAPDTVLAYRVLCLQQCTEPLELHLELLLPSSS